MSLQHSPRAYGRFPTNTRRPKLWKSTFTRRTLIAGTAVAPAAAALAVPGVASDRAAILARAEQVVELLRSRYICEGWHLDEVRAVDFLESVRRLDFTGADNEEITTIVGWAADHGQSVDWIIRGDVAGMICSAAAHPVPVPPTSYLFA
jgi:hypothetical protein